MPSGSRIALTRRVRGESGADAVMPPPARRARLQPVAPPLSPPPRPDGYETMSALRGSMMRSTTRRCRGAQHWTAIRSGRDLPYSGLNLWSYLPLLENGQLDHVTVHLDSTFEERLHRGV